MERLTRLENELALVEEKKINAVMEDDFALLTALEAYRAELIEKIKTVEVALKNLEFYQKMIKKNEDILAEVDKFLAV